MIYEFVDVETPKENVIRIRDIVEDKNQEAEMLPF